MGFNKAKAEEEYKQEWIQNEKMLREAGLSEEEIQEYYEHHWYLFRQDRRFYEHNELLGDYVDQLPTPVVEDKIETIEDVLKRIENPEVYYEVKHAKPEIKIAIVKRLQCYSYEEIGKMVGLSKSQIFHRTERFLDKLLKKRHF